MQGSLQQQALAIAEQHKVLILDECAQLTAQDIKVTLMSSAMFASVGQAEVPGASQIGATPLRQSTIRSKTRRGSRFPLLPRVDTGAMLNSVKARGAGAIRYVQMTGERNERIGIWQQFGTSRGIPPRPFFGISDRALRGIQAIVARNAAIINNKLAALRLPGVHIRIAIS